MTYKEVLKELDEVNLKEKFTSEYEGFISDVLLHKVKETNKIASVGSLIRSLMIFYVNESKEWLFWQKALVYFMTPKFARNKKQLLLDLK